MRLSPIMIDAHLITARTLIKALHAEHPDPDWVMFESTVEGFAAIYGDNKLSEAGVLEYAGLFESFIAQVFAITDTTKAFDLKRENARGRFNLFADDLDKFEKKAQGTGFNLLIDKAARGKLRS